jgi:hypothetical protein
MRGHLRKRGNAWELRAYAGIDPLTNRQKVSDAHVPGRQA